MHSLEIERRLRLPAPDEPRALPALVLPASIGDYGKVRGRTGFRPSSSRAGFLPNRFVLAVLTLLVALAAAIATGALRLDNPFDSTRPFGARGLTLAFPNDWKVLAALNLFNDQGQWTSLIVSNEGVEGCSAEAVGTQAYPTPLFTDGVYVSEDQTGMIFGMEDRIYACVVEAPMAEGEIRLVVMRGFPQRIGIGPIEPFDSEAWFGSGAALGGGAVFFPTPEDGWDRRIDGMPAKLIVETTSIVPGAEEVRTWGIFPPEGGPELWYIRATLKGPDLEALRAEAEAIVQSIRFDTHPAPLDETTRDVALRKALDQVDRETREFQGSDLYGCFPRASGSAEGMVDELIRDGGPYGRLAEPVAVTCTTSVERGELERWRAVLTMTWAAGDGYDAGERSWDVTFDANGALETGISPLGVPDAAGQFPFPGTQGPLPAPIQGSISLSVGALAEVLPPGISYETPPVKANFQQPSEIIGDTSPSDVPSGSVVLVVDGPIHHVGVDWYRVQLQQGAWTGEYGWLPVSDGVRPLLQPTETSCPTAPTIEDLVYMHAGARVACFGDEELQLDPTMAALAEDHGNNNEIGATPEWLARYTLWRLYGAGGSAGLDAPLPFAIAPALGDSIPTGAWIAVRGHFDHSAAADCRRTYPEAWGNRPEDALTILECRQLFVITGFETRSAP